MLVNNPYEGSLNAALYQQKIAELEALLQTFTPQNGENSAVSPSEQEEQQKTQRLLDYYSSAAQFTAVITVSSASPLHPQDSVATVSLLLNSSTEGDVLAALHFLPLAAAFSIKGIDKALRRMNLLVWGASPAVMKELVAVALILLIHSSPRRGSISALRMPPKISRQTRSPPTWSAWCRARRWRKPPPSASWCSTWWEKASSRPAWRTDCGATCTARASAAATYGDGGKCERSAAARCTFCP